MKRLPMLIMLSLAFAGGQAQVSVNIKVYLQGPYAGNGLMYTRLYSLAGFPHNQPYIATPWKYGGQETVTSVPDSVVDWVMVELRSAPDTIVSRRAGLLTKTGKIVDVDLVSPVVFPDIQAGSYYVAVFHRNHFPVMTAAKAALPMTGIINFTDTNHTRPYGGGIRAVIQLTSGVFGMISGDVNINNQLKYSGAGNDRSLILQRIIQMTGSNSITGTVSGYHQEDLSMDSIVKYSGPGNDPARIIQNIVALTGSNAITGVYNGVVPAAVMIQTFGNCGDTLKDIRDGQSYATVQIGNRCWMATNLNIGTYVASSNTASGHTDVSNNGIIEKYCYDNNVSQCAQYGGLYDWNEMMGYQVVEGAKGICPGGWHLPSDAEWKILEGVVDGQYGIGNSVWDNTGYRGSDAGGVLKEAGLLHWNVPNTGATNASGFWAIPGGCRHSLGSFSDAQTNGYYWSSTPVTGQQAFDRQLAYDDSRVRRFGDSQDIGFSVRCVRDTLPCTPSPDQSNAGPDMLNIAADSVILQANNPGNGTGAWGFVSGGPAFFSNAYSSNSVFYGQGGFEYKLIWVITTACGYSIDTLMITFTCSPQPDQAIAGPDSLEIQGSAFNLHANVPVNGTGVWSLISGQGGFILAADSAVTYFFGSPGNTYKLAWTITNICGSTADTIEIGFGCSPYPDQANAGPDSLGIQDDNLMLGGNLPTYGSGVWRIISGLGGILVDSTDPGTLFFGLANTTYSLAWEVYTLCGSTSDTVEIGFDCAPYPDAADAGPDLLQVQGGVTALMANSPVNGDGTWSMISGNGGMIADPYDPNAFFFGNPGMTDTLVWTITTLCGFSTDTVIIGFACNPQPDQAFAGLDSLDVAGTSLSLYANVPVNGLGRWKLIAGIGGLIADSTAYNTLFFGIPGGTYTLVWTISNFCGSNSDTLTVGFGTPKTFSCGNILTDIRDGQQYPTVQIGVQCWMGSNLNYGQFVNSNSTSSVHSNMSNNGVDEKYCLNNNTNNCLVFGGLYEWNELMKYDTSPGIQGICPDGWHVPTDNNWRILEGAVDSLYEYWDLIWNNTGLLGYDAGGALKEAGTTHWNSPNSGATNSSGFTALPGGARASTGNFSSAGSSASYWTSSHSANTGLNRNLGYDRRSIGKSFHEKEYGYSVRCILNCLSSDSADAGPDVINIATDSIQLQANNPLSGTGQWKIISGSGGTFANETQSNTIFYGQPAGTYELAWIVTSLCNAWMDMVTLHFSASSCGEVFDVRDGQRYASVLIGTQCWMGRNLNVGRFKQSDNNGTAHSDVCNNDTIEKYCYLNDTANCSLYGGLYDWNEMMDYTALEGLMGICPDGWHLPTDSEWTTLIDFLGGSTIAGGRLKESGFVHWNSPNTGATNSSGFGALPAGARLEQGFFMNLGTSTSFWSSSTSTQNNAYASYYNTAYNHTSVYKVSYNKQIGHPVRCIKGDAACLPQPDQAIAGPDMLDIPVDSIILQANVPVNGNSNWAIASGTGGNILTPASANSIFHGQPGEAYRLVWTISNQCGANTDTVQVSFAVPEFSCGDTLADTRDGQHYPTVQIGVQCWMGSNLNYGQFVSSTNTGATHSDVSNNGVIEKYCYNNDSNYCLTYGGLYDWNEMMGYQTTPGSQGICPDGWHIPTDYDWILLEGTVDSLYNYWDPIWNNTGGRGYNAGGELKEIGILHWSSPNTGATNASVFTALAGGSRGISGGFSSLGTQGTFWTSSSSGTLGFNRYLYSSNKYVSRLSLNRTLGFSVRCTKDCGLQPDQANAGPDSLDIAGTSIQLQANSPVQGSGVWRVISATGAYSLADTLLPNTVFSGTPGQAYELLWIISSSCDISFDKVLLVFNDPNCDTLSDTRDGKKYPAVQIGSQCWMARNLDIGKFVTSSSLGGIHSDVTDNDTIEKYCYSNDTTKCSEYGGLYDWTEMMGYTSVEGSQGICPDGWHLPSEAEWTTLSDFLGGTTVAGGKLKETGTLHWNSPNSGATNSSGFGAIGGGYRAEYGSFTGVNAYGYYWTTSLSTTTGYAKYVSLNYNGSSIGNQSHRMLRGYSVRCVKDSLGCGDLPDQANAGPDSLNIPGDSIQLQANVPVNGIGLWTIASGIGGNFADPASAGSIFRGQPGEAYFLVWTISNACGSNSDTVQISFAPLTFSCGNTLTDTRDSQQYPTIQIGTQCWMASNLAIGTFVNSMSSGGYHSNVSDNGIIEKYCYNNDEANCSLYGGLYDWQEMMAYNNVPGSQGICPQGWHIPTMLEWRILEGFVDSKYEPWDAEWDKDNYRGFDAGPALKETGLSHWASTNQGATNAFGFTALPGGYRDGYGTFAGLTQTGHWWTSSVNILSMANKRTLHYLYYQIQSSAESKVLGLSVRCIRDCDTLCDPANAGPDTLYAPGTSLSLQANIPASGSGRWYIVASTAAGSLADSSQPNTMFYGEVAGYYELAWVISTSCDISYDIVVVHFKPRDCGTLTDPRDNQQYPTVLIGTQCWMAKNLNAGEFVSSNSGFLPHSDQSDNDTIEKYCYQNNPAMCDVYGGLYEWNEMMGYDTGQGIQGICPEVDGWHLPSEAEWDTLISYLGGTMVAGGKMKQSGLTYWNNPNSGATNSSGFCALSTGSRYYDGSFSGMGYSASYWSSTRMYSSLISIGLQSQSTAAIKEIYGIEVFGYAARCVKDTCSPPPDQANTGPDSLNIPDDSIQLQANVPVNGNGLWTIASGNGGHFADSSKASSMFHGQSGETYSLVWTISNACGSNVDTVQISFAPLTFSCGNTLTDTRDGQQYPTVEIGTQCWMAKNLNVGSYIPSNNTGSPHPDMSDNDTIEKYCFNNDANNCNTYGGMYEWDEMMDYTPGEGAKGICPEGWHIPSSPEWATLVNYLGGEAIAGGALKESGYLHWSFPNMGATNSSQFTALASGYRTVNGDFTNINGLTYIWHSTAHTDTYAYSLYLGTGYTGALRISGQKVIGFSVRCLQDFIPCTPQPDQADAGTDTMYLEADSIQLYANQPVNGSGEWHIITGLNGVLADSSANNSMIYGEAGQVYALEWTISTICGQSKDTVYIGFGSFSCGDTLKDYRDGQKYPTTIIGGQCWMARNLNYGKVVYSIFTGSAQSSSGNNGVVEKYCYNNDTSMCSILGGLYDWDELMDYGSTSSQGICPKGWRIPGSFDHMNLIYSLGGVWDAAGKLKATGSGSYWSPFNTGATNSSGYSALGAGYRKDDGSFVYLQTSTAFWSTVPITPSLISSLHLFGYYPHISWQELPVKYGLSVRCLRECSPLPDQASAGPDVNLQGVDSLILQANNPTEGSGTWTIVRGNGGSFSDSTAHNAVFYGQQGEQYTLRWTIATLCGISFDTVNISFSAFVCGDVFQDYRGTLHQYRTTLIGEQCWMAENLNVGTMVTSVSTTSDHSDMTNNGIIQKYCYNNSPPNCDIYGGLYEWNELMDYITMEGSHGICPDGWHIPTNAEFSILVNYLGGNTLAGGRMKEASLLHWLSPNTGATDIAGFTALPGGYREKTGSFTGLGGGAVITTSSSYGSTYAYARSVFNTSQAESQLLLPWNIGFSVRCLADTTIKPDQADAGPDQLDLGSDSTQLQANNPQGLAGLWRIIEGVGGILADSSDANSKFFGRMGRSYILEWSFTSKGLYSADSVRISFLPVHCEPLINDPLDGQQYPTVLIGNQCWMAKNLNRGNYTPSTNTGSTHSDVSNNGVIEKYCRTNDPANCNVYGGLYDWNEMMAYTTLEEGQGICPDNWHVPTKSEWDLLIDRFGGYFNAGGPLKETGTTYWLSPNTGATNSSGFTALPGSGRTKSGGFLMTGKYAEFWSSTLKTDTTAYDQRLESSNVYISMSEGHRKSANSLRCIRNCSPAPDQSNAGPDILDLPADNVQLQGNLPLEGSGLWSIVSGIGGHFADSSLNNTMFYGHKSKTYTLVWSIATGCGMTTDTVVIKFVFPDCGIITDARDGRQYPTVIIGQQCWMAKNLNVGRFVYQPVDWPGPQVSDNDTIEKYCMENDSNICNTHGGLYDWNELMEYTSAEGAQGICPDGWHVPSLEEWNMLVNFLGGEQVAGGKLKDDDPASWWNLYNAAGSNSSGFSAISTGVRTSSWEGLLDFCETYFWTSTEWDDPNSLFSNGANTFGLQWHSESINWMLSGKENGYSMRCIRNCTPSPEPAEAGSDQLNLPGDSTELQAIPNSGGGNYWVILQGQGGSFSDSSRFNSRFYGRPGVLYELGWVVYNNCGTNIDAVNVSFAYPDCGTVTDLNGRQYPTVQIGDQCWMAKNLNLGIQETSLAGTVEFTTAANNAQVEKYCYANLWFNCDNHGALYDWDEMMAYATAQGAQGICPTGWHVPDTADWSKLITYLGNKYLVGGRLKENGTAHWADPNDILEPLSGFEALPTGFRHEMGGFDQGAYYGYYWTSTQQSATKAYGWVLRNDYLGILPYPWNKKRGFALRCIRDCQPAIVANAGPDLLDVPGTTITLQATVPPNGTGKWTFLSGSGGSLQDINAPNAQLTGVEGNTYILKWTVTDSCGSKTDTMKVSFATPPFLCNNWFKDIRDGKRYPSVYIAGNCWMAANLDFGTFKSSANTGIPHSDMKDDGLHHKYCYNNIAKGCATSGALYEWGEMMEYNKVEGAQGICPAGWHIPTDAEWSSLAVEYNGLDYSGFALKDTGTVSWNSPNYAGNALGFSARGSGYRSPGGQFQYAKTYGQFWTSTTDNNGNGYSFRLKNNAYGKQRIALTKDYGASVRCVSAFPCGPQQAYAGPDSLNVLGSMKLQANEPITGSGTWTILSGTGGHLSSIHNPAATFTGDPMVTYELAWTITNSCGSNSDIVIIRFNDCGLAITYGGEHYPTVPIGTQCWMAKNLNIGTMVNSVYAGNIHSNVSNNGIIEKYCNNNDQANCAIYGGLYDWNEMMGYVTTEGTQGICPNGWHVPTDAEWCTLTTFLDATVNCNTWGWSGTNAVGKMMEMGTTHWYSPNTGATNSSGFTALGAGARYFTGDFGALKIEASFWSSSKHNSIYSWSRNLYFRYDSIGRYPLFKEEGLSVRCLRNEATCTPQPDQANAGPDSTVSNATSIQLQANNPVNGQGSWSIFSGTGGSFNDASLHHAVFTGQLNNTYTLVWSISNTCGSNTDTVLVTFSDCGSTILYGGEQYPTVLIGTQCWMAKNLNIGTMVNSVDITGNEHSDVSNNGIIEKYCYNNDINFCNTYGGLYDWNEMMDYTTIEGVVGICPSGWHIPTDAEWTTLESFMITNGYNYDGTTTGNKIAKALASASGWLYYSSPGTVGNTDYPLYQNKSGFSALAAGCRHYDGIHIALETVANFWSSSQNTPTTAYYRNLSHSYSSVYRNDYRKVYGFSVRCLRNDATCTPQPDQAHAGPDSTISNATSIQLQANNPVNGQGNWSIFSGNGGSFNNVSLSNAVFTGQLGSTYTLVWTIATTCGSNTDTVLVTFSDCGSTILYGGEQYPTVLIGSQCWMAKNLNIGTMVYSIVTPGSHTDASNNGIFEKFCYNNDINSCNTYGGLYEWNEMMDYVSTPGVQGICPPGWHIPQDEEWGTLENFLGGNAQAGGKLKESGALHWTSPNTGAVNSYGFTALPGGYRHSYGYFFSVTNECRLWSSSVPTTSDAWGRKLTYDGQSFARFSDYKTTGLSVRCLRNDASCTPQPDQANAGPDSTLSNATSIQLQANNPVIGQGSWSIYSGNGGSFNDASLHNALFTGQLNTTYTLVWAISNTCGTRTDTVLVTFFDCGSTLLYGGEQYPTVQIGTQCWMAKNLNIGAMVTDHYTGNLHTHCSNNGIIEKYCYNNDAANCAIYGGLYDWNEMMNYTTTPGTQGICPTGWHIPTDAEWCTLTTFLDATVNCNAWGWSGTNAGGKMKETGTTHWDSPNTGATNSSGFTALGAGARYYYGYFGYLRYYALIWSSSEYPSTDGFNRGLSYDYASVNWSYNLKTNGFSVRCLRNN